MESRSNKTHPADKQYENAGICCIRALAEALSDWQAAVKAFDSADEPLAIELAAIRMQESSRRYGCLAAQYRQ